MRGQLDYGALAPKETTAGVSDMGEIAARLGSIVTYDKRGDVIDFDNFEEPVLKWGITVNGALSTVYLDSTAVLSGSQAVKLYSDDIAGAYADIVKGFPILASKKLGLEVSFNISDIIVDLEIYLSSGNGIVVTQAGLKISLGDGTISILILDSPSTWKEIASGITFWPFDYLFNTIKLVVDFDTGYYMRLLFNNSEYDLSSEVIYHYTNPAAPNIWTEIKVTNPADVGGNVWIEDVVWTQAEP